MELIVKAVILVGALGAYLSEETTFGLSPW